MIEMGLVIAHPWIDLILAGEKTWEIRSQRHPHNGRIALCAKGGPIVGTAIIAPPIKLAVNDLEPNFKKHRVSLRELHAIYGDRETVYAWPITDVKKLDPPLKYSHPGGGSWVALSEGNVDQYARLR